MQTFDYSIRLSSRARHARIVVRPDPECYAFADNGKTCINTFTTGNVLINDVNPWGHAVELVTATGVNHPTTQGGTINFAAPSTNGFFTYTPATDFLGIDTFEYRIIDLVKEAGE